MESAPCDRFEDVAGTAIYVDSPYTSETRGDSVKNGRGGRYLHEFTNEPTEASLFAGAQQGDHERLADILKAYKKARVVVSYYDCERVRSLYEGWTFIDCQRQKHLHAQNGRGARPKLAPEVLIVNGPAY